jgi:hypothetical protein
MSQILVIGKISFVLYYVRKQACLAIRGVIRMVPTAVIDVLLGLPSLHVMIKVQVQAGICRIMAASS